MAEPGSSEYEKENQAMVDDGLLWLEFYKNIPNDFAEMIKAIMRRKGITQENLSFGLGVDRKALLNYLNQDRPSVAHALRRLSEIIKPKVVSLNEGGVPMPVQSVVEGAKLAAFIDDAVADSIKRQQQSVSQDQMDALRRIEGKVFIQSMSVDVIQFLADAYRCLKY